MKCTKTLIKYLKNESYICSGGPENIKPEGIRGGLKDASHTSNSYKNFINRSKTNIYI